MERLDFKKYLEPDEKILWQGIQTKKTTAKLITPVLFIVVPIIILFAYIPLMDYVDALLGVGSGVTMAIMSFCSMTCIISICYACLFIPNFIRVPLAEYVVTNKGLIRIMGGRVDIRKYHTCLPPITYDNRNGTGSVIFDSSIIGHILFGKRKGMKKLKAFLKYVGIDKDFYAIENISDADKVEKIINDQIKISDNGGNK